MAKIRKGQCGVQTPGGIRSLKRSRCSRKLGQPFKGRDHRETWRDQAQAKSVSLPIRKGRLHRPSVAARHVKKRANLKAFKTSSRLPALTGRGSEKNPMLQRIYGTAFPSKAELDEYLHMLEEAKKTRPTGS